MIDYTNLEIGDLQDFSLTLDKRYQSEFLGISQQLYAEWRGYDRLS